MIKHSPYNPSPHRLSACRTKKARLALAISCVLASPVLYAQEPETQELEDGTIEEILVRGVRASQSKAIDIKRNSAAVVDSIVAEDIGKLPDVTITDSLQRVTGVQITRQANEGTTLNVRGMPQVLTTLNGEQFLSPWSITEVQANYSDVPAGIINGVDVFKSQSAATLAGGISGVVDLKTLRPSSLKPGWTASVRAEGSQGSRSDKEAKADGSQGSRTPDYNVNLTLGHKFDNDIAFVLSAYDSSSYAANYSIWDNVRLGFLNQQGGTPGDPYDLNGNGDLTNDWYMVPESFGARSNFMERERTGATFSIEAPLTENLTARADVIYNRMDQFDRGVYVAFSAKSTPVTESINGVAAQEPKDLYNTIQTAQVGSSAPISYVDGNGVTQNRTLYALRQVDVWAGDFQTVSTNDSNRTASLNTNFQLDYTNHDNVTATLRYVHASAEKLNREADFQQGTPMWLWVDEDGIPGKDPVDGYHVSIDYTRDIPSFSYVDDLSSPEMLKQYQGFAEGYNADAELNVLRADVKFEFDHPFVTSVETGLRHGVREANYDKFFYVTPTGRYTTWEDPRVPTDKRYLLLPGNLVWQKYPDWLKFNYDETNLSLIDIGGLQDNGFSGADTMPFTDFGPIQGFEQGVSSLNPAAWDNPLAFMNRLYPGTRTVSDPGYRYGVEEAATSAYLQLNFLSDTGVFGVPYSGNLGLQVVRTQRDVEKSVVPEVLDIFNSIGYDDWQKIAYVYDSQLIEHSFTEVLPSINLNFFPTDNTIVRFGAAKTMTNNNLENVGSGLTLWYQRCPKTDEDGNPVMVRDPSTGNSVQDDLGCVGGGSDRGRPDIEPWMASVYNLSGEWYFAQDSMLGVGLFLIDVANSVEDFQEQRNFADLDGINRGRMANIWTTRNVGASDLYGIEMGYKQPFTFLPGDFLSALGAEFNYTWSQSDSGAVDIQGKELPLPSNSEHQTNLILWYDKHGLNVRLAYNWRSEEYLGRVGLNTNEAEMVLGNWLEPTGYLDLSVSYQITDNIGVYFNGTNLTEQSRRSYAQFEDQFQSLWVQERRFALGVNVSL